VLTTSFWFLFFPSNLFIVRFSFFFLLVQIESEQRKNMGANLERINADCKQMKAENAQLIAQLKGGEA
jgi:hypothetical protein